MPLGAIALWLTAVCAPALSAPVKVFVAEADPNLHRAVTQRLESRIGGSLVDSLEDADWVVEQPADRGLSERLGHEGFAWQPQGNRIRIVGNSRRARLYGLWELIERERRAETPPKQHSVHIPQYAIRGDVQNPHTPYKLSRQDTLRFWEEYFSWAIWIRMSAFMPFQSNGRIIVPRGYPDYRTHQYATGGGFSIMKRIYELCRVYGIDFYYPLHLFPVPAETGFRDEPSTSNEFFYPGGVEERIPRFGPFARPYETKYHLKFPEYFTPQNQVNLAYPGVWNAIETEMRAAQDLFPEMTGFLLDFAETNGHSQRFTAIYRQIGTWPALQRTFRFVKDRAPGKKIAVFHHGAGLIVFRHPDVAGATEDPIEAIRKEFPDFLHIVDLHPGPQHPGQPVLASVGPPEERKRLCRALPTAVWTICDGEHIGRTAIAYAVPRYIYRDLKEALALGAQGSFQRTGNYDFGRVPGTLLEVNAYTAYRLLWNPDLSLDELWREWIGSRFGAQLVKPLREVLDPIEEVVRKGLLLHNCPMFGIMGLQESEHQMTGSLQNPNSMAAGLRYPTILDLFQPPGVRLEEVVRNNQRDRRFVLGVRQRARPTVEILGDRAEAVAISKRIVQQLRHLKGRMKAEDYRLVLEAVENLQHLIEISALFTEALYYEKMAFIQNYDQVLDPIQRFEKALEKLESGTFRIRQEKGEYFFYGLPQAMSAYRQMGRLRLEAAAATQGYRIQ